MSDEKPNSTMTDGQIDGESGTDHAAPKTAAQKTAQDAHVLPEVDESEIKGIAAFFEHPEHLMYAAEETRDSKYEVFDALSPFPIHGMDDALGVGRSWLPWVTFFAGLTGLTLAACLEFGIMVYAWPLNIGGKPHASWPAFIPIMFELTVLVAGLTTVGVMFKAAGCFKRPLIIDRRITDDMFVLWIGADDANFDRQEVIEFMKGLNPVEIRTITEGAK